MPKKTFYLSDADLAIYEKLKLIAGDKLNYIIMQGMRDHLAKWEKGELGFEEILIFEGQDSHRDNLRQGQQFKFIGKLISETEVESVAGITSIYKLYLTRKGKFLVLQTKEDVHKGICTYKKQIVDNIEGLKEIGLPDELLISAGENMPDLFVETLDI